MQKCMSPPHPQKEFSLIFSLTYAQGKMTFIPVTGLIHSFSVISASTPCQSSPHQDWKMQLKNEHKIVLCVSGLPIIFSVKIFVSSCGLNVYTALITLLKAGKTLP